MSIELILVERVGVVATVRLNRPEKLNALTKDMWLRLGEVFEELSRDNELRCIVLSSVGGKSFSPGNDITEFETERANKKQAIGYGTLMENTLKAIRNCPVPTVAEIHGICVGGGMEIAGCCDIRICGTSSRFGAPIKNLGLVMAYGEIEALVKLVGADKAKEILFEGKIYSAAEALDIGIVSRVVHDENVHREALETVERITSGAPLVARWHKKFLNRLEQNFPLTREEWEECFDCYDTQDFATGRTAFVAKEKPEFEGR